MPLAVLPNFGISHTKLSTGDMPYLAIRDIWHNKNFWLKTALTCQNAELSSAVVFNLGVVDHWRVASKYFMYTTVLHLLWVLDDVVAYSGLLQCSGSQPVVREQLSCSYSKSFVDSFLCYNSFVCHANVANSFVGYINLKYIWANYVLLKPGVYTPMLKKHRVVRDHNKLEDHWQDGSRGTKKFKTPGPGERSL